MTEARIIQSSWNRERRTRQPDFQTPDFNEVVTGFKLGELTTVDRNDGAYCCLQCRREIYRLELPAFGDPAKGGKGGPIIRPLPDCGCNAKREKEHQEIAERMERRARLSKHYSKHIVSAAIKNASFENWIMRPGTEKAHEAAQAFDKEFEGRTLGLLLIGAPGNGKSHLARAVQRSVDARGWATLFLDWPQLVELAKSTFDQHNISVGDIIRGAVDADLLVFDELGAGKLTDWEFKTLLFPIINGRSGKKTLATTNLNLKELEQWFMWDKDRKPLDDKGRLFDRLLGNFQMVQNDGTSKRREDARTRLSR